MAYRRRRRDLPLFIDPFQLFNSRKPEYQKLHDDMIGYLQFLRDKSRTGGLESGLIKELYTFPEVKQNWLGFSQTGNKGSGLGVQFAFALNESLVKLFADFGQEKITKGSHLEKLCLIKDRVGKDYISDFTTNLIKGYLLEYTQSFARDFLDPSYRRNFAVQKVRFNYTTESWETDTFELPSFGDDFVLLTPRDMLTKDDTWINKQDLVGDFDQIPNAIPDEQLRAKVNNYFFKALPKEKITKEDRARAVHVTIHEFPELLDYYIKYKEDNGERAKNISEEKVVFSNKLYVQQFGKLVDTLARQTDFYGLNGDSYDEAMQRVQFLKDVIENKDGYRLFYANGKPIQREEDLQICYRLTWFATTLDVNREVNNGRGPVDFKASRGAADKTLVEFKLAKNTALKKNLKNQVEIYKKANDTEKAIKVILFFSDVEHARVHSILKDLGLENERSIVLIDASRDNKVSASKADAV